MRSAEPKRPNGQLELWTPEPVRTGQEEINLVEWPFAVLSDQAPKETRSLTFSDTIRSDKGKTLNRKWTITAPATGSLPTATDEAVYMALMEITQERGMVSDIVPFSRHELCQRLGWLTGGKEYKRLDESLKRLAGVTIEANNAFWDKSGRVYRSLVFHIIDELAIGDGRAAGGEMPVSHIRWSNVLFASMQSRYLKSVDMDFFLSLRSSLARRLYRWLDRKRWTNEVFQIGLQKLCFEHLAMARTYGNPELRRSLGRAHRELIERGFLQAATFETAADGQPKVMYVFTQRGGRLLPAPAAPEPDAPDPATEIRTAERRQMEDLDALITPEIQAQAEEIVAARPQPRPRRGTIAWTDMVKTEARRLVKEADTDRRGGVT